MKNLENIEVYYEGEYCIFRSKVYYVDPNRDRFLLKDDEGYFIWVRTDYCKIWEGGNTDDQN